MIAGVVQLIKSCWERENYIEVCTFDERRGTEWWKMGI
jgi:hypothetical protein